MTDSEQRLAEYERDFAIVIRAIGLIVTMPEPDREHTNVPVRDLRAFARVVQYQTERIADLEIAAARSSDSGTGNDAAFAFGRYGSHDTDCRAHSYLNECDCGYSEAMKQLTVSAPPSPEQTP